MKTMTAAFVALCAGSVMAQPLLGNLPGTSTGAGTNLGLGTDLADRTKAVGLTMGGMDMFFTSMNALVSNPGANAALSGGIYSSVGGNPGALLAAFGPVNVASGTSAQVVSVTTAGAFQLDAGASYWFVLDGPAVSNSLIWNSLTSNAAPTGNGASFDGYRFSSNGGGAWGSSGIFNGFTIDARPIPAPGAAFAVVGAGLFAARRRRA